MIPLSHLGAASFRVRLALGQFMPWPLSRCQLVAVGEACFVGGWSLMWATSLGIIPYVPRIIWLMMMIAGLLLARNVRRR